MNRKLRSILVKYGITAAVGALLTYATLTLHGYSELATAAEKYRLLSDAFTIPGVVIALLGVLVFVSNEGAFEGISYAVGYAVKMLMPFSRDRRHERYADYVERKREKGGVKGYGFLFVVGAAYLAASAICIALFYSVQ